VWQGLFATCIWLPLFCQSFDGMPMLAMLHECYNFPANFGSDKIAKSKEESNQTSQMELEVPSLSSPSPLYISLTTSLFLPHATPAPTHTRGARLDQGAAALAADPLGSVHPAPGLLSDEAMGDDDEEEASHEAFDEWPAGETDHNHSDDDTISESKAPSVGGGETGERSDPQGFNFGVKSQKPKAPRKQKGPPVVAPVALRMKRDAENHLYVTQITRSSTHTPQPYLIRAQLFLTCN
jgi:hypothetical protein